MSLPITKRIGGHCQMKILDPVPNPLVLAARIVTLGLALRQLNQGRLSGPSAC
jgi:hypothetical protein